MTPAKSTSPLMSILPRFRALAAAAGAAVYGPIDQGDFLNALGLQRRTQTLQERASPAMAEEIGSAALRLTGKREGEMGALFKALAITPRSAPTPPGFARTVRAP